MVLGFSAPSYQNAVDACSDVYRNSSLFAGSKIKLTQFWETRVYPFHHDFGSGCILTRFLL